MFMYFREKEKRGEEKERETFFKSILLGLTFIRRSFKKWNLKLVLHYITGIWDMAQQYVISLEQRLNVDFCGRITT